MSDALVKVIKWEGETSRFVTCARANAKEERLYASASLQDTAFAGQTANSWRLSEGSVRETYEKRIRRRLRFPFLEGYQHVMFALTIRWSQTLGNTEACRKENNDEKCTPFFCIPWEARGDNWFRNATIDSPRSVKQENFATWINCFTIMEENRANYYCSSSQ